MSRNILGQHVETNCKNNSIVANDLPVNICPLRRLKIFYFSNAHIRQSQDTRRVKDRFAVSNSWIEPAIDSRLSLRHAFGCFATGVTVVATWAEDGSARAFTANSFSSVSLDPPLLLVCIGKFSASLSEFLQAAMFSVSVLEESQDALSGAFASRDPTIKIAVTNKLAADTVPYVEDSIATFLCQPHEIVDAGDHIILIGRIDKYRSKEGKPLAFFRGNYASLTATRQSLEKSSNGPFVCGICSHDGGILLSRRAGSRDWEFPMAALAQDEHHHTTLAKYFSNLGVAIAKVTPYGMVQETDSTVLTLVFRVELEGSPMTGLATDGTEIRYFTTDEIPWDAIGGKMRQSLVRRYLQEAKSKICTQPAAIERDFAMILETEGTNYD